MGTARAQIVLATSFLTISTFGAIALAAACTRNGISAPEVRSALLVIVMACVHALGYILYSRQRWKGDAELISQLENFELSSSYASAFRTGICLEAAMGILTALILDGGETFKFFGVALLAHWIGMILILWRRPLSPTKFDLSFIRIGIIPLLVASAAIGPSVWKLIGESNQSGLQRLLSH